MSKKSKLIILNKVALVSLSFSLLPASWLTLDSFKNDAYSLIESNKQLDTITRLNSGFDYIPVTNNVNAQPVSTSVGFLGINSNNNVLYLTSYEGVTVWEFNATNNSMIKSFYKDVLNVNNISGYTIKSWKYLSSIDVIAIILSDASSTNSTVFGIKADTGLIFAPILDANGNPKPASNMVTVNDGSNVLWENSSGQVIATVFGDYATYSNNTYLISFQNGVSKFVASIRNIAISNVNAQNMVNSKVGKTETIGSTTITYNSANWTAGDGSRWKLQAVIEGKAGSNTNIAVFTDTNAFANVVKNKTQSLYLQQAVLVDDNLNPINNNNVSIAYTFEKFITYNDSNNIWLNPESLQKYGYAGKELGDNQKFVWVTSGIWNAATELTYNSKSKTLSKSKVYDLQWQSDQDIYTYSYDVTENRLFTSNSYTSSQAAIGYIDFDDNNLSYKSLVTAQNGDIPINNILKFSPVFSPNPISETPLVYFDPLNATKLKGLYFQGSTSKTVDLTRKTYLNIQEKAQSLDWYTNKSASSVTKEDALKALEYDSKPLNGNFINVTESINGNDINGTLDVKFKTTYNNWWNQSTTSSFYIETLITGMYATSQSSFSFVTVNNGIRENDDKLKAQVTFKENNYPSSVTYQDVSTYFCLPNIKDIKGQNISLTKDMITLTPNNEKGELKIKVDYSSVLPKGLSSDFLIYEHNFSGFNHLSGYEHQLLTDEQQDSDSNIVAFKNSIYPSELTLSQFFDYFIILGNSYSKNINDWKFTTIADIYSGKLIINLEYSPVSISLPNNFPDDYKVVANNYEIKGFKKVVDDFKDVKSIDYKGIKSADYIWSEYENASNNDSVLNTTLSKLIDVPYVNFSDLQINKLNTSNNSEELDLTVSVKSGTVSSLIVNRTPFVFDDTTENNFATNNLTYPFNISVKINTIEQKFAWKKSDSSLIDSTSIADDTFRVNLNKESYPSLNSQMYANDVTIDNIFELFICNGFVLNKNSINLFINNQEGIVYATINLISTDINLQDFTLDSSNNNFQLQSSYTKKTYNSISDGSNFTKRIEISGFKKPISPIYISIFASVVAIIAIVIIAVIIYLKVIRKNLKKLVNNKQDNKYISFLNKKENLKKEKIEKNNYDKITKNYVKRVKNEK